LMVTTSAMTFGTRNRNVADVGFPYGSQPPGGVSLIGHGTEIPARRGVLRPRHLGAVPGGGRDSADGRSRTLYTGLAVVGAAVGQPGPHPLGRRRHAAARGAAGGVYRRSARLLGDAGDHARPRH